MLLQANEIASDRNEEKTERRNGFRLRQDRPVKVFEPGLGRYFGGRTHDCGTTGLRIELPVSASLAIGKTIQIQVGSYQPGETLMRNREMLSARVVWLDRNEMLHGRLVAGVQFLKSAALAMDAA